MGGLFLDGEDVGPVEDISKWTVEDVCSFVAGLAGCSEYVQVRATPRSAELILPVLIPPECHLNSLVGKFS